MTPSTTYMAVRLQRSVWEPSTPPGPGWPVRTMSRALVRFALGVRGRGVSAEGGRGCQGVEEVDEGEKEVSLGPGRGM